ncbi:MAG: RDD family protein [Phycisphaerales bacterium]|nr:RDD family protein [Phycisphaerales bacterium]
MNRRTLQIFAVLLMMWTACSACSASTEPTLLTASGGDHIWFVLEPDPANKDDGWKLCHAPTDREAMPYRVLRRLSQRPERIAAYGDRVWLIMHTSDSNSSTTTSRRSVHELEVDEHATIDSYFYLRPADHEPLLCWFTGDGDITGCLGTEHGPVVLLAPTPSDPAPTGTNDSPDDPDRIRRPTLLAYDQVGHCMAPVDTTVAVRDLGAHARLIDVGNGRSQPALLMPSPTNRERSNATMIGGPQDGAMFIVDADWPATAPGTAIGLNGQVVALASNLKRPGLRIAYLRSGDVRLLAETPAPTGPWGVVHLGSDLAVIQQHDAEPEMMVVHGRTGVSTPFTAMAMHQRSPQSFMAMIFVFCTLASVLFLIVVLKPAARISIDVGVDRVVMPPSARLVALMVDLLPGALLALMLFDIHPSDLLRVPYVVTRSGDAMPFVVMVGTMLVLNLGQERFAGRSLGHRLIGAEVLGKGGIRPTTGALILRNVLKALTVVIPPITIFALVTPQMLSLHDVLSQTTVSAPRASASESNERPG